jgi:hypothetical protein
MGKGHLGVGMIRDPKVAADVFGIPDVPKLVNKL